MPVTPQEEIERQHTNAIAIIDDAYPCAPMIDRGEIPLEWKQSPTVDDPMFRPTPDKEEKVDHEYFPVSVDDHPPLVSEEESNVDAFCRKYADGSCTSSRGIVNVEPLAKLVMEGCDDEAPEAQSTRTHLKSQTVRSSTNLWDEVNACQNNVLITRPSHDNWGIKKIVFMFCDDFLRNVYEMPWWHGEDSEMRDAVRPILDALDVPPERVVRMLLAALPPGVTIPVHHDSGEWVRLTHRVHVPIINPDPDRVLFMCGPTESSMNRIPCTPGHVFEMNNQGKHSVSNCQSTHHRIHLILDYVDTSFSIRNRLKLRPGENIIQTRRSIDREIDAGSRPTPSFLIIGVQKSGTTSLYEYMNKHPLVIRAKRRETHCLDWRWDESLSSTAARIEACNEFFYAKELRTRPSCLTGDSTPSYLLDSFRCIPRLKEVFPHWSRNQIKLIAILRDPVNRCLSHWAMVTSLDGTPQQIKTRGKEWLDRTFEEIVEVDMRNMKESGLIPYWDIERKTMDLKIFDKFVGTKEENYAYRQYLKIHVPMNTGSHSLISRGMYELQLRQWFREFPSQMFLVLKLEDMKAEGGVQRAMDRVWTHLDLPPFIMKDVSAKNTRSYSDPLSDEMKDTLARFFAPHNQRLKVLLGGEWENPW